MDGPGRVFFLKPANPIAAFIWDCYLTQSMYVCTLRARGHSKAAPLPLVLWPWWWPW